MIKLLKNNEDFKLFVSTIYNKFRNQNSNFPYEMIVDWVNHDMIDIVSPDVKKEMNQLTEKVEEFMLDYEGNDEEDQQLDKLDEETIEKLCNLPNDYFPIVVSINAFGNVMHDYISFDFESANELNMIKNNEDTIKFLKEYL